jgi:hydrogenase nickel incorporation protein HypA/HybF
MHELSLCQSIRQIVERASDGRPVEAVYLQVGQLRQVVPETLATCWALLTESTPLSGSTLAIEHVPVVLSCRDCGGRTTLADELLLACVGCGSTRTTVLSGEELLVTALDLAEQDA